MDRLLTMQVFVRVAQLASFAAAARDLRMSTGAVSKHVTALEEHVGMRLFDRTTRRVATTEAGRIYLEHCLESLQTIEEADAALGALAREPRGLLRVTAPVDFALCLVPVVAGILSNHPKIAVDLRFSNRVVEMVEEGVDVGIRVAAALDGRYVARPLARTALRLYGTDRYFRNHGRPRTPQDVRTHRTLVFAEPRLYDELVFTRAGESVRVKLESISMTSNNGVALRDAAHMGAGLCLLPSFLLGPQGVEPLVPVLTDWSLPELRVFAVYPHRRFVSPKVRTFVEAMRSAFGDGETDPWATSSTNSTKQARLRRKKAGTGS